MIWEQEREEIWSQLDQPWDVIVIGGGITGAGVLREAAAAGLKTLLLEARDFGFGTSSRSGKFVHGGIRYLRNRQYHVTFDSVRERERLIRELPGCVQRQEMSYLHLRSDASPAWRLDGDVFIYELLAGRFGFRRLESSRAAQAYPGISPSELLGGCTYSEGLMDDSRLVLRVIREAVLQGGVALNYAFVQKILHHPDGRVAGVLVRDESPKGRGWTVEVLAPVIIQATGYWCDALRSQVGGKPQIRKSRGSHLNLALERLPIQAGMCYYHPSDQRIQFLVPWQGVILAGTTDLDERSDSEVRPDGSPRRDRHDPPDQFAEPGISAPEVDYILSGLIHVFPHAQLDERAVVSTFCGIRPIIQDGGANVSRASRRHQVWDEAGLVTISGGKLTTYRLMAHDALRAAMKYHPRRELKKHLQIPTFNPLSQPESDILPPLSASQVMHLLGKYGPDVPRMFESTSPQDWETVGGSQTLWAELRWAARREAVVHLDDLLLRRVRVGLTLPKGGSEHFERLQRLVQAELGWDEAHWHREVEAYLQRWQTAYSLPIAKN